MDERDRRPEGANRERALWRPRAWANNGASNTPEATYGAPTGYDAGRAGPGPQQRGGQENWLAAQSPQAPRQAPAHVPDEPGRDDQELNPPWERESGMYPVPEQDSGPREARTWDWNATLGRSYPTAQLEDFTGTGPVPVIPLLPGDKAWSGGVRPPRLRKGVDAPPARAIPDESDVEVDKQPSIQMRAMRAGNLARATAIVSAALLLSRVFGLLRTTVFASTFGPSLDADAFTNAFVIPDTIFNIVAGGALASAFIPVFADYLIEKRDKKTAWYIASTALNLSIGALTLLAVIAFVFARQAVELSMSTFLANHPEEIATSVNLTRIMLLQPIFLGGATITVAILQARQSFVLPAVGQVIYNISLIGGILATLVDNRTGVFGHQLGIYGPAWGVVVGAAAQFVIQIPGLAKAKMVYRPSLDVLHPGMRQMIRLMLPRLLNAAMLYVSIFINRNLLGLLGNDGAIYGYVTAFSLVMLPIGVFGMAVSQASFPTMAAFVAAGEWGRLRGTIMQTVRGVTYLAVPSALGIIALATPLSWLILAHGNFDAKRLPLVSTPLIFFAVGLLGLSLVEILVRSFYALHDTRTAVEVSILQFMFVIGMSILLLDNLKAGGLALATALGSTGEAAVLLLLLRSRVGGLQLRRYALFCVNVLAASVVAALTALVIFTLGDYVAHVDLAQAAPFLSRATAYITVRMIAAIVGACVVFYLFARFLGIADTVPIGRIARRLVRRR